MLERAGIAELDPWQTDVLRSSDSRTLLLATRQGGKSTVAAGKALHKAQYKPGSLSLLLSPSERQSGELFKKVLDVYTRTGRSIPTKSQSALRLELSNGSRIEALPGTESSIRGYSAVDLLVCDEASRIPDELWFAVRPMVSVSQGDILALSTPFGKRGWFYSEWSTSSYWKKIRITARECPRLTEEILEQEEQSLGTFYFRQEYLCEFLDTSGVEGFINPEAVYACSQLQFDRSRAWLEAPVDIGLDVSRSLKGDKTAFVAAKGNIAIYVDARHRDDLMDTCGAAVQWIETAKARSLRLDDGGVGGGVTDRLLELQGQKEASAALRDCEIIPIQFGRQAFDKKRFADWRSEAWFHLGELMRRRELEIPDDPRLMEELTRPAMGMDSQSRLKLESKEHMKARGLASPDIADALALASYPDGFFSRPSAW